MFCRPLKALAVTLIGVREDLDGTFPIIRLKTTSVPQQISSITDWEPAIANLLQGGAGPTSIYDRLRTEHEEFTGSLSAVKRLCARLRGEQPVTPNDVAIRVETAPGEVAQVDFGYAGRLYDPAKGVVRRTWLFVMVLGYSRNMVARLVFDQKVETWLRLHIECFKELGGVPEVIVPDNLKAAVIRAAFGVDDEPALNRSYCELARHYGFQIDPTPPRAPQKKGKVERAIRYVKQNFFAARTFADIDQARRELGTWVREIAGLRRHGTTNRQPLLVFEEEERGALRRLPHGRWERTIWKKARVHRDCHVQIEGGFYSVPWRLLGQEVWARYSEHDVRIHHEDQRVATHARVARGERSTLGEHLPEERRDLRHRSKTYWLERAARIGPESHRYVEEVFDSDDVLLHLRRVQGIVSYLEQHPRPRAEAACLRARHYGNHSYLAVKNILRKGLDMEPLEDSKQRVWSQGSRFARNPKDLFQDKE